MPRKKTSPKYIFVTGGVISGLGKGITSASISLLLKSRGFTVFPIKCDMYLNIDAGTMNPLEHGEIFVTDDGTEADQDLGHYERFLEADLVRENYVTAGQVYRAVLDRERSLGYDGKCVDAYLYIPEEIIRRLKKLASKADVLVIEFGGTVGEYQNVMFFEAARRMKIKYPSDVIFVHVGYLPLPSSIGEMKTKPMQQSVHKLNELGIQPDLIICRSEELVDNRRKEKIALAAALSMKDIFSNPDVSSIYEVPILLEEQGLGKRILEKSRMGFGRKDLSSWRRMFTRIQKAKSKVKIAMVGKYYTSGGFSLEDSYVSVVEAVKHAAWSRGIVPQIIWLDSEKIERFNRERVKDSLRGVDGIIVPQGWGERGVEGKIKAVQYAREKMVPYLGLCFGMQMAVIEFARHGVGLARANSTEVNPRTPYPVIHIMPKQKEYLKRKQYGGTIRLGAWPCVVKTGSILHRAYGRVRVLERHRHRYELNNRYKRSLEAKGMVISGTSPDGKLVEAIELDQKLHPFFVGIQFHPEYKSRPLNPHPIFLSFIEACKKVTTMRKSIS